MTTFQGRVIAITGAGSGIGRGLAIELARRGSDLALSDVNETAVRETAGMIEAMGRRASARVVDVAQKAAMHRFAEEAIREHGHVDGIVNNAGVTVSATFEETSYEDFEWIVGINFWGVVHGTKAFLPHLLERKDGWIVNVSSVFGLIAFPTQSAYNATKFAVRGMTESLRQELAGSGVTAICVHPGGIKTNIVHSSRWTKGFDGTTDRSEAAKSFEAMARTTPERAGEIIADGMERRSPRILVGPDAHLIEAMSRMLPVRYPGLVALARPGRR
jgi:NAD(P)-dependent dehydrogenase (short-subunit alcohol dehydrogenase family)